MDEEDKTPVSGWTLLKNGVNRWAYDWRLALAVIAAGGCVVLYAMFTDAQRSYQEPPATGAQVPGKVLSQPLVDEKAHKNTKEMANQPDRPSNTQ